MSRLSLSLAENGEITFRPGSEVPSHELDFLAHFLTVLRWVAKASL